MSWTGYYIVHDFSTYGDTEARDAKRQEGHWAVWMCQMTPIESLLPE